MITYRVSGLQRGYPPDSIPIFRAKIMKRSANLVWSALLLLISTIGLVAYGSLQVPSPKFRGSLHGILPPPPLGWTMKEKPIADSAEMKKAVAELLNYDDGVFVDYTRGTTRLSVYIAYWSPGKMPHRLVASHTPDVCWVGGGWKRVYAGATPALAPTAPASTQLHPHQSAAETHARAIPKGEERTFTAQGTTEYVWFWHLVGEESKSYGTGTKPPWFAPITDLLAKGLNQRDEQFFIRLSSNVPMRELQSSPILWAVLTHIPWPEAR
jgi:hypothetical protein